MKVAVRSLIFLFLLGFAANAQTADQLFDRAMGKFKSGDYAGCITDYRSMLVLTPENAIGHYNLGLCYSRLDRRPEAIYSFRQATKYDPQLYPAHVELGNSLDISGAYADAIVAYNKAIKIDPNKVSAYLELGVAYNNAKDYQLAIAAYNNAARLEPNNVRANFGLGQTYYNLKNKAAVKRQIDILTSLDRAKANELQALLDKLGPAPTPTKPVVKTAQRIKDEADVAAMRDFGFDAAVVTAVSSIRATGTKLGKVLLAVKRGDILSLVDRKETAGFYSVVDEKSGVEGYIDANSVVTKFTTSTATGPSLNDDGELENRLASPSISIRNEETATTLKIRLNGILYSIPPQTTKVYTVKAGKFTYYGWSPGIRPATGSSTLVNGRKYSWVFKIYRR